MGFVAYEKDFEVSKSFNLAKFLQVLDKENFHPFISYIEKSTEYQYRPSFQHTKTPIFVAHLTKRNIADEILLSECTFQFLKSVGRIRFIASIRNSTIIVIGSFTILFMVPPIIMPTALAWMPIVIFIVFQLLEYYWDIRRYHRIAELAMNFNQHKNNQ